MSKPKISIVTPSFNQGQFLGQTIESIISQGHNNLEYFVIDGDSTDNSVSILEKHSKQLTGWISEKDDGQSYAINKGLKQCSGKIFNWLNSDDYLESTALSTINQAFDDPTVNVFIGRSNIVLEGKIISQSSGSDIYSGNLAKTIGYARIDQPEHWWRKAVIDQIGPLNQNLHYTMDRDWWIKYLLMYGLTGIKKTNDIIANFRLHDDSKTVSHKDLFNKERNAYYQSICQYYNLSKQESALKDLTSSNPLVLENMPEYADKSLLELALNNFFCLLMKESYATGNFRTAKQCYSNISLTDLQEYDREFIDKLRFRMRFPSTLISMIRQIKKN